MKKALAILLLLVTPSVCPGTVLESDPPAALTIVEPALLVANVFVTVYNGRFIEKRSLLLELSRDGHRHRDFGNE